MKHSQQIRAARAFRSGRRGFTLTEIAVVLGIIGLILGAVWAAASSVYRNNHNKIMATEVLTVVNGWKSLFGAKRVDVADGTDITQRTVNNNFAPADMVPVGAPAGACVVGGTAPTCFITSPGSGNRVNVVSDQTNNAIDIQFSSLTQAECNYLGNTLTTATGLIEMNINGTASQFPPLGTATPLTGAAVSTNCSVTTPGNTLSVKFLMN